MEYYSKSPARQSKYKGHKISEEYGKSAALNEGFKIAQGEVVITMDADLQDSPDEIPGLRKMVLEDGYDIVSGWKKKRYDNTFSKNIPSKIYNAAARRASGIKLHDFNCGLKAYKNKVIKSIEVYGEMHRYIPLLAKWSGFKKFGEKVVEHRQAKIWSYKIWLEPFYKWIFRSGLHHVCGEVQKKSDAFFWIMGNFIFL